MKVLKGTLDDFTLPDIFRFLSSCKKTGCIEVHRSAGEGRVFFRNGDVYFGESSLTREPLGQMLVRAKLISETDLRQALDVQAQEGGRLGDLLVAAGKISHEQVGTVVKAQIEAAVFDLLRWELGEFTFSPEVTHDAEVAISVSVENLIMETSRKLEELEVIATKIPSETAVLAMAPTPPTDAAEINITPDEWRILVLVTGNRSVAEIADSVGVDNFSVMRTLYGLASTGLIEVMDAGEPAAEVDLEQDTPPTGVEEPVDAGLVAEQLDAEFPPFEDAAAEDPVERPEDDGRPLVAEGSERSSGEDESNEAEPDPATAVADLDGAIWSDEPADIPIEDDNESESVVDRLAAVKELADLFQQTDADDAHVGPPYPAEIEAQRKRELAAEPAGSGDVEVEVDGLDGRHRVEDDEEITRGLISRLIDGVKGL